MNLKVPGAILPLGCAILSTRAKTVRGVVATPLMSTTVKARLHEFLKTEICVNVIVNAIEDRNKHF